MQPKSGEKKLNVLGIKRLIYKEGEEPIRVYYSRYADEFLIGVAGPKVIATEIKEKAIAFLKSNLQLSTSRAQLIHAKSD